jgi:DpnII restriction endonuclease
LRAKVRREKVSIPYSSKKFIPDFVFDSFDLALDTKLCNSANREREIVDEINADIPAYHTKYGHILFVIYDVGFIRDVAQFKSGIEAIPGVRVIVIKHQRRHDSRA